MKRKAAREARSDDDEGQEDWEQTRSQARHVAQERAPRLPVRAAADEWVTEPQREWQAVEAVPAVQGITVEDDLAAELARQREEQEAAERRAAAEEEQRAQAARQRGEKPGRGKQQRAGPAAGLEALRGIESREQRRTAAKLQLAAAAQQLLQDPNKHVSQLKLLLELLGDEDAQVGRLAMLSLLAVFRDLIPAYRIRKASEEEEPLEKLSKEVRALRTYEAALLDAYHSYLKALLKAFKASNAGQVPPQQGRIAVKCMAGLLEAAPHFNYRSDLLQALVSCLPHKEEQIRGTALGGLAALLAGSSGDGEVATEAVQLVADLVRRWKCVVPPASLDCLLGLRFPDIADPAAREKISQKQRKKQRKAGDEVDRAFLEAQAAADVASRRQNQTATLDALFELLFRVLKHCSTAGVLQQSKAPPLARRQFMKKFPLLFPALRLLSKFVHLISIEYIQDITAELRALLASPALPPQERLRVLLTAAEVATSQGGAVSTDHAGFFSELYAALKHVMAAPLLDASWHAPTAPAPAAANGGGGGGQREEEEEQDRREEEELLGSALAADDGADAKIGGQVCYLLPEVLSQLLLEARTLDIPRQAAFVKRILAAATSAGDSGLAMGLLCILHRLLRRSRRLQGMLQHEAGGPSGQSHRPEAEDPAEASALSSPLWELTLLSRHYHPHVASAAGQLAAGSPAALLPLTGSAAAYAVTYTTCMGAFNPAPQPQRAQQGQQQRKKQRRRK